MKNVTDNTEFWKTVVPFFSDKTNRPTKIYLKKNDRIFSELYKVAEELSSSSEITIEVLNIKPKGFTLGDTSNLNNPVEVATKKVQSHPTISIIKGNVSVDHLFQFEKCHVFKVLR